MRNQFTRLLRANVRNLLIFTCGLFIHHLLLLLLLHLKFVDAWHAECLPFRMGFNLPYFPPRSWIFDQLFRSQVIRRHVEWVSDMKRKPRGPRKWLPRRLTLFLFFFLMHVPYVGLGSSMRWDEMGFCESSSFVRSWWRSIILLKHVDDSNSDSDSHSEPDDRWRRLLRTAFEMLPLNIHCRLHSVDVDSTPEQVFCAGGWTRGNSIQRQLSVSLSHYRLIWHVRMNL